MSKIAVMRLATVLAKGIEFHKDILMKIINI